MRRYTHTPRYIRLINSSRWKACVAEVRRRQDNCCAECRKLGIVTPIDSVHHLTRCESIGNDAAYEQNFFNLSSLVGLCRSHHEEADYEQLKGTREANRRKTKDIVNEWYKQLTKRQDGNI